MRIDKLLLLAVAGLVAACDTFVPKVKGACGSDAECPQATFCNKTIAKPVCEVRQGECFPVCETGKRCESGACIQNVCPAQGCQAGYVCDQSTGFVCVAVTQPKVDVTSPGANAFASVSIQATARAVAPGGVTGVRFEVRRGTTVLGSATATHTPVPSDQNNYAATITLSGSPAEGPATLVAIESWNDPSKPAGSQATTTESSAIAITLDFTAPTITMVSDGRNSWIGPTGTATVTATIQDSGGAGVKSATLNIAGNSIAGTAGSGNTFNFAVPVASTGVAAGSSSAVAFTITAADATAGAGNSATLSGNAAQVVKVDRIAPTGTVTPDNAWHAANETVTVNGTAADPQSGLTGGVAGVALSGGTLSNVAGTITGAAYTVNADLSTQTFGATEGNFNFNVAITDNAGNTVTLPGTLKVDNKPPQITNVTITSTPADGVKFFKGLNTGTVEVTAAIKDAGAGVAASTVKLTYVVPGNPTPGVINGVKTTTDGDGTEHYRFAVPLSAGLSCGAAGNAPCDGSSPVVMTVTADDNLAAGLSGAAKAPHQGSSAATNLFFDSVGPTVSIAADTTWYKGGAGAPALSVNVSVSDGSGSGGDTNTVALTYGASNTVATKTGCAGNVCTFTVPVTAVTGEIALALAATASDKVGNAGNGTGSRNVDAAAPTVTIDKIYVTGGTAGIGQIEYPAAKSGTGYNTGYDGGHFLLSDSIHVKATITDAGSGVASSSLQVRLDGTANGTAFTVTPASACDGASSCTIEADVALNGTNAGAFDAATGTMTVRVLASDKAGNAGAVGSAPTVGVTRFWWSRTVASNNTINGLAVHPNGDVIATTTAGGSNDTVFALHNNGPFGASTTGCAVNGIRWCYGSADSIGTIKAAPAIGQETTEGTSRDSRVYVVGNTSRKLVGLDSNGSKKWLGNLGVTGAITNTPAVARITITGSGQVEAAFTGSSNGSMYLGHEIGTTGTANIASTSAIASGYTLSSPIVVGGAIYSANSSKAVRFPVTDATFGTTSEYSESVAGLTGIAFGGGSNLLYAAQTAAGGSSQPLQQFTAADPPSRAWAAPDPDLTKPAVADPVVGNGVIYVPVNDKDIKEVTTAKAVRSIKTLAAVGLPVLLGSDGRIYAVSIDSNVYALAATNGSQQWNVAPGAAAAAAPTMDCAGHLFVGADDTVYAYITDARGLANTPWPKFHRDTRNSGNADLGTVWGVRNGATCTQ